MKQLWKELYVIRRYQYLAVLKSIGIQDNFPGNYCNSRKEGEKKLKEKIIIKIESVVTDAFSISFILSEISGNSDEIETTIKSDTCIGALLKDSWQIRLATTGEYITLIPEQNCLFFKDQKYERDKKINMEIGKSLLDRKNSERQ